MNEDKLKDAIAEILMSPQKNKRLDRILDAVYSALDKQRTDQQRKGLHLWFRQISDLCLEHGIDMRMIVKEEVPIPCTPENIKMLWKMIQQSMFGKKSTNDLKKTGEIDLIQDTLIKVFAERTHLELPPFPFDEAKRKDWEQEKMS